MKYIFLLYPNHNQSNNTEFNKANKIIAKKFELINHTNNRNYTNFIYNRINELIILKNQ